MIVHEQLIWNLTQLVRLHGCIYLVLKAAGSKQTKVFNQQEHVINSNLKLCNELHISLAEKNNLRCKD